MVVLSAGDSLKPEADPARLVFCGQPLDEWLGDAASPEATCSTGGRARTSSMRACSASIRRPDRSRATSSGPGRRGRGRSATRAGSPSSRSTTGTTSCDARTGAIALRREALRALYRRGQGWCETSARDFAAAFSGDEWCAPLRGWLARTDDALLRAYRERLFRAAFPRAGAAPTRTPPRDRVRRTRRRAAAPAHGPQGRPDRLGALAGAVRPRRRLDRHAALHAARRRPSREPRGGPQRAAADPGLLPPHGGAPRARALDRPRLHRDVHALRGASRLPGPRLSLRAAEGGPVPDGLRRGAVRGAEPSASRSTPRVGARDHAAVRGTEGLGARHVLGARRGDPGRAFPLPRAAGRARRADPAGAAGGADAHHRRRLAGPDRRARVRRQVRREPAGAAARTR